MASVVVLCVLVSPQVAFASAPGWSSPASIDPSWGAAGISCSSSSFCVAVGAGEEVTYDGISWSAPTMIDSRGVLQSVSCASPSFCVAGDSNGNVTIYNGISWSAPALVDTANGGLLSISCVSSLFCVAISYRDALTYDGTTWTTAADVDSSPGMSSVSCSSSSFCLAVGDDGNAFTYDGSTWSGPTPVNAGRLYSVSCASPSFCLAVSNYGTWTKYDGTSWSSPVGTGTVYPTSVSCPSVSFCAAMGNGAVMTFDGSNWSTPTQNSGFGAPVSCPSSSYCASVSGAGVVTTYNGSSWTAAFALGNGRFNQISCPSASFCAAVDWTGRALTYDGSTWTKPTPADGVNAMTSVSCANPSFCLAVDKSGNWTRYDGSSWTAATFAHGFVAVSVSCPSATFCAAAGTDAVETFNGSSWSGPVYIRGPGRGYDFVSCPSASFCMVVDVSLGYALTYNGSSWSSPTQVNTVGGLQSVSCTSRTFCAAVDYDGYAVTYDGTSWSAPVLAVPLPGFQSVSCASSSFCVALDTRGNAVMYNGSDWSAQVGIDTPSFDYGGSMSCQTGALCAAIDENGNVLSYLAPTNSAPAAISGTPQQGAALTLTPGAWTRSPTSITEQWEDCGTSGGGCSAIGGATSSTYTPTAGDVGHTLRVLETATNSSGSSQAFSSPTAVVVPPAPTMITPPAIGGTARQGDTLTLTPGSWTNSPTSVIDQWEDCDSAGGNCIAISGANSSSYVLSAADVGHTIRVLETATNPGGSAQASSGPTPPVLPDPPATAGPPGISGVTTQGQTLTESHGTWTNSPTAFAYQWEDCDSTGGNCVAIAGATSQTYTLAAGDVDHTIAVLETASNAGGSSSPASSSASGVVQAPAVQRFAPSNSSKPVIAGAAIQGQTLTTSAGTWSGTAPVSFAYQWERCSGACSPIDGATGASYTQTAADVGSMVAVVVTAANSVGSAQAVSSVVGPVVAAGPAIARVKAALVAALSGRPPLIGQLLRHGGHLLSLSAPSPGRLVVRWYSRPARGATPLLVGSVSVGVARAGTVRVTVALSRTGRRLLRHTRRLTVTETAIFTPSGQAAVSAKRTVVFRR